MPRKNRHIKKYYGKTSSAWSNRLLKDLKRDADKNKEVNLTITKKKN